MNRDDCLLSPRVFKSWFFLVLPLRFMHLVAGRQFVQLYGYGRTAKGEFVYVSCHVGA